MKFKISYSKIKHSCSKSQTQRSSSLLQLCDCLLNSSNPDIENIILKNFRGGTRKKNQLTSLVIAVLDLVRLRIADGAVTFPSLSFWTPTDWSSCIRWIGASCPAPRVYMTHVIMCPLSLNQGARIWGRYFWISVGYFSSDFRAFWGEFQGFFYYERGEMKIGRISLGTEVWITSAFLCEFWG